MPQRFSVVSWGWGLLLVLLAVFGKGCTTATTYLTPAQPTSPRMAVPSVDPTPATPSNFSLPSPPPSTASPRLLLWNPLPGSLLPMPQARLRLVFDRAMDPASVDRAVQVVDEHGNPLPVRIEWPAPNEAVLRISGLEPGATLRVQVGEQARDAWGATLERAYRVEYHTLPPLKVTHHQPTRPRDVDPRTDIVLVFNQPVVGLEETLHETPPPFTLEPTVEGRGRWTNPSTYVFRPEPHLAPSTRYTLRLREDLRAASGAPLAQQDRTFSFQTQPVQVESLDVSPTFPKVWKWDGPEWVHIRPSIRLELSLPLPLESVTPHLCLAPQDATNTCLPLVGEMTEDDGGSYTFAPEEPLAFDQDYVLRFQIPQTSYKKALKFHTIRPVLHLVAVQGEEIHPVEGSTVETPVHPYWEGFSLHFDGPLAPDQEWERFLEAPKGVLLNINAHPDEGILQIQLLKYEPDTVYTFALKPGLRTPWGTETESTWTWKVKTPKPPRSLSLGLFANDDHRFLMAQAETGKGLPVYATQVEDVVLELFTPRAPDVQAWFAWNPYSETPWKMGAPFSTRKATLHAGLKPQAFVLPLADQGPLPTGFYLVHVREAAPPPGAEPLETSWYMMAVVNVHLTVKRTARGLWVWAVDMETGEPVPDAPVQAYDHEGRLLWEGRTDEQGMARWPWEEGEKFGVELVSLGRPGGRAPFGLGSPWWHDTIAPWDFDLEEARKESPFWVADLYTDRPLYKPGDTVHFRLTLRRNMDGRYRLLVEPLQATCRLVHWTSDFEEETVAQTTVHVSQEGVGHGTLHLPQDAAPGSYTLECAWGDTYAETASLPLEVAHYRKPTVQVQVQAARMGEEVQGEIRTRFYSGGAAGGLTVDWEVYYRPKPFHLPGYHVGDDWWWESNAPSAPFDFWPGPWSGEVWRSWHQGQVRTDPQGLGTLTFPLPASAYDPLEIRILARTRGPDGVPAVGQDVLVYAPQPFYLGWRAEPTWPRAGEETQLLLRAVRPEGHPVPRETVRYAIYRVELEWLLSPMKEEGYQATYILVDQGTVTLDERGQARIPWTPPTGGLYAFLLESGQARTRGSLWVVDSGDWWYPGRHHRLEITLDQNTYRIGEIVEVFVPNPWPHPAYAWVTLERHTVHESRLVLVPPGGDRVTFTVTEDHIPNMFVAVVLVGGKTQGHVQARYGLAEYRVPPETRLLQVEVQAEPETARPGEEVTLHLRVTDAEGQPVQGVFSIAVVDQALLDIAQERVPPVLEVFYKPLGLGVRTGLASVYDFTLNQQPPPWDRDLVRTGLGGGGGDVVLEHLPAAPSRRDFRDTAFWLPEVRTDAQGRATVTFPLPDNLTLWNVWVRGLDLETRVGEARGQVRSTLPVLLEPVTPAFFMAGDRVQLAAVVHNNTDAPLPARVTLQAQGLQLEGLATQEVTLPAHDQVRVTWWAGVPPETERVNLNFAVQAGPYADRVQPKGAPFPVYRYWAEETLGDQGVLDPQSAAGVEIPLMVPQEAHQARLQVGLALSPLASLETPVKALQAFPYFCSEQLASRLWVQASWLMALQHLGRGETKEAQALQRRIQETWAILRERQLSGGWAWWSTAKEPDPVVTAYVLWAGWQAHRAGVIPEDDPALTAARSILAQMEPEPLERRFSPNFLAFLFFVMAETQVPLPEAWERWLPPEALEPAGLAFRAALLQREGLTDRAGEAWNALEDAARHEADAGVAWPAGRIGGFWGADVAATATVTYVLAHYRPETPLLPRAVQYLLSERLPDGTWGSTFATAWSLAALTTYAQSREAVAGQRPFRLLWDGDLWLEEVLRAPKDLTRTFDRELTPGLHRLGIYNLGIGPLLYQAQIRWSLPASQATPLQRGLLLERIYEPVTCEEPPCAPLPDLHAAAGQVVRVRLRLHVYQPLAYVVVEDRLPAGGVALNPALKHERALIEAAEGTQPRAWSWQEGWGWWVFAAPEVYPHRVVWAATRVSQGTYELTYLLDLRHPGTYQTAPARAWAFYRPTLQATTSGALWTVEPAEER